MPHSAADIFFNVTLHISIGTGPFSGEALVLSQVMLPTGNLQILWNCWRIVFSCTYLPPNEWLETSSVAIDLLFDINTYYV